MRVRSAVQAFKLNITGGYESIIKHQRPNRHLVCSASAKRPESLLRTEVSIELKANFSSNQHADRFASRLQVLIVGANTRASVVDVSMLQATCLWADVILTSRLIKAWNHRVELRISQRRITNRCSSPDGRAGQKMINQNIWAGGFHCGG